jgi:hypothetical protein
MHHYVNFIKYFRSSNSGLCFLTFANDQVYNQCYRLHELKSLLNPLYIRLSIACSKLRTAERTLLKYIQTRFTNICQQSVKRYFCNSTAN